MFRAVAAVAVIVALSTPAALAAQAGGEAMRHQMPPGFKLGYETRQGPMHLVELVPAAETVDNWTKMVTLQTFSGGIQRTPAQLLDFIAKGFADACPNMARDPITSETIDGLANAFLSIRCPRNPATGKPENVIFRAMQGRDNFYVAQVAVRYPAPAKEAAADHAWLRAVAICDASRPTPACATH
ncbi:hypothetical protein ACFB49_37400 [Sphingomonas sp. DBB INV C78]|uniref:hypothetical protein n=1 Tax=Sphingomonas sp. DBB INV C78 TaxID=3349434 RepID=UPI0036D2AC55